MELSSRRFALLSLGMGLLLFVGQLYLEGSSGFTTGWDAGALTSVGDRAPGDASWLGSYFSVYPNQLFLYGLFHKLTTLASLIGAGVTSYCFLVRCGCLCVTVSIVLASFVCRRLFGDAKALIFQALASLFLGMSGWVLVPYSDAYGMLFTCAALWFYVIPRHRFVRLSGVTAASLLGYMVKPTAIFLLFAIMCLDWVPCVVRTACDGFSAACARFCVDEKDRVTTSAKAVFAEAASESPCAAGAANVPPRTFLSRALVAVAPVLLGAVLAVGLGQYVEGNYFELNPNASRGMTHFLAMGLNPETKGCYSSADNEFSSSYADPDERRSAQIGLWKERLVSLGPIGVAKIWFEKNLTNYADGTFSWRDEGSFITGITGDSDAAKSWLGIIEGSTSVDGTALAYGWFCQIIWLMVLLGCAASALRRARGGAGAFANGDAPSASRVCVVMALALIFLSGFLLVFECRARYLYLFSPYYVVFAIDGLIGSGSMGEYLACRIAKVRKKLRATTL